MKGVWRARIATRLNDVSPVNFLIAFHRGCQHNPLEESAVSKGMGLARAARGHFENAACHGNERSSTCTGRGGEASCVRQPVIRRRARGFRSFGGGIVGGVERVTLI